MRIERAALHAELPVLSDMETPALCELLAGLGFPVDAVEGFEGTTVLEVDVTPNRGDAMSHRGLARDLSAKLLADLSPVPFLPVTELHEGLRPIILESEACPCYASAILELGSRQETPTEVQAFLRAMGSSPKNLAAVDASNELLHRYGHPTHAFDEERLQGAIRVRKARKGESFLGLDGVTRTLSGDDLVIADDSGAIALAGVIGGEATKVTEGTRRVLLESAWFDPKGVRLAARRHGIFTDASHRFGRGADPAMARIARDLLLRRLEAWAGARVLGAWCVGKMPAEAPPIAFPKDLLQRIAGEPLRVAVASEWLQHLGCRVQGEPGVLHVTPPSWRHDLTSPEDLAEEVLRIRGYDKIPSALPPLEGSPLPLADGYRRARSLGLRMAHLGFHQTVTFGFVSPEEDAASSESPAEGRTLGNPLGIEFSVMRASLLGSLRKAAESNLKHGARQVRLFEIAPVYRTAPSGPLEIPSLGVVWGGQLGGEDPYTPTRPVGAADLRGIALDLGLRPEHCIFRVLGEDLFGLECPLDALPWGGAQVIPSYRPFSRFPAVHRDLSLLVAVDHPYRGLADAMAARVQELGAPLQDLRCVDVFRPKGPPPGKVAWLFRFSFQHPGETLTHGDVDRWMNAALDTARAQGAELRG
ncbi:MAG: phenylalanine--tRNA ligase subunit beta [Acidobacteria bacterium]|nr:phenylalanine--tRNA ligase subunit beta [Acidobacteriota bacterium]